MNKQTILTPLDGSELSERALAFAVARARATGSGLKLLRSTKEDDTSETLSYLEEKAAELRAEGLEVEVEVRRGNAVSAILEAAEGSRLIVMSSVGRGGFGRWLLGSVTERVVRAAPCPVLVIGGEALKTPDNPSFDKVLVPLDGSKASASAIAVACDFLTDQGQLLLYRALITGSIEHDLPHMAAAAEAEHRAAREYLDEVAAEVTVEDVQILLSGAPPTVGVITTAEKEKVDLIVMTTRGATGLERLVCGSVTESVLQSAVCPVLVVPPKPEE